MKIASCFAVAILLVSGCASSPDQTARIAELESENQALEEEVGELRKIVDLCTSNGHAPHTEMPEIHGAVMAINVELDSYILDAGSDDGVEVGFEFTVYRGNEYVGTVVIDKVEKDYSSGHSRRDIEKSPIEVGDLIATRL